MLPVAQLYGKYISELERHPAALPMTEGAFARWLAGEAAQFRAVRRGDSGLLLYATDERAGTLRCTVPVFGISAPDEQTLSRLFEALAEQTVSDRPVVFSVSLYAHDDAAIRLLTMLQFGMISEKGIRRAERAVFEDASIRVLSKAELAARWPEVWRLTDAIVRRLRQSPVFYPGTEFTEALYRRFYFDGGTTVFGAFDGDGALIGLIETNAEQNVLAFGGAAAVNIGEAYVLPAFRRSGLAKKLLLYAETHSATDRSWVEHGTANPHARGFWGKYYTTYQYTMIREINPVPSV